MNKVRFEKINKRFLEFDKNKKKLYLGILSFLLILISLGGAYFLNFTIDYTKTYSNFEIVGGNFDLNQKKIPYNATSIDFSFSDEIDTDSITQNSIKITPGIEGSIVLKDKNTISYVLNSNLEIGSDYNIVLSSDLKSINGLKLTHEVSYILSVVKSGVVQKFLPTSKLENLSDDLLVFFSIPMINLTGIENQQNISCPIKITPEVEGDCIWLTNSVLKFKPKNTFAGATNYEVKIENIDDFNYPLENDFETTFSTQNLETRASTKDINPVDGLIVNFNFPVNLEDLEKYLTIDGEKAKITKNNLSDVSFVISKTDENIKYNSSYNVKISKGLPSKYGNIPLDNDYSFDFNTTNFVLDSRVYKDIYSLTGELIDTIDLTRYEKSLLSNKNSIIQLFFYNEISLDKNLIDFSDEDGKKIDYKLSYYSYKDYKGEIITNKNKLRLTILSELNQGKKYELKLLSSYDKYLDKDVIYTYKVPEKLELLDYKLIDYTKSCLYVNNYLDEDSIVESFITPNGNKIVGVNRGNYIYDYKLSRDIDNISDFTEKNKKLIENGFCPLPDGGQIMYSVETRFIPNSDLEIQIKHLKDLYGGVLENDFSTIKNTGILKQKDLYIYSGFDNLVNIYPTNINTNFNIQSINANKAYLDICELNETNYQDYLDNRYGDSFNPVCTEKYQKTVDVENHNWNLTNTNVSLGDLIGKENVDKGIYLVQFYNSAHRNNQNLTDSAVIIKSNLSLYLEKSKNKKVLFATDLENNQIVKDLNIEVYDYKNNLIKTETKFNSQKNAYEITGDFDEFGFIKASNKNYYSILTSQDYESNYDFKYISGQSSSQKYFSYIYSDRPIYKIGDEVNIKGIFREFSFEGYKISDAKNGTLKIYSKQNYGIYKTISVKIDENGNFDTSFTIPNDSLLGDFYYKFQVGDEYVYTTGNFSIEQYVKPDFRVSIQNLEEKETYNFGDNINLEVSPEYYFGGKITNTTGNYNILTQNYYFDPKEFSSYQFGENDNLFSCLYWGYCDYDDKSVDYGKIEIDENGKFQLNYNFKNEDNLEKIYTFGLTIKDPNTSKEITNYYTKVVNITDGYVGIKSDYFSSLKDGIKANFISLNTSGEINKNKNFSIEIYKRDWSTQKVKGVDGNYYSDYSMKETLVKTINTKTDSNGIYSLDYDLDEAGEYFIKAIYTGANNQSYISSKTVYVIGNEYMNWKDDNNTTTDVIVKDSVLNVGDTANFVIKSPVNTGKIILFVEKDDGILDYFTDDLDGYTYNFDYKLKDTDYPNIYLKVFLIGKNENDEIITYKRGLGSLKVLTDYKKLDVNIITQKDYYNPGNEMNFQVKVTDELGKPVENANLSVGVVDESVLALKGNPKKNPYSFFYEMKRYLGVTTYLNLKNLVDLIDIKDVTSGEKGGSGDDSKGGESQKERGNFKDTAYWTANISTNKDGIAVVNIDKLPDNLTTWVIEAVANTNDTKIGAGYSSVMTSKKVVIQDNLPSIIYTGDKIILSPVIHNKTGVKQDFSVNIETSEGKLDETFRKINLEAGESKTVNFELSLDKNTKISDGDLLNIKINSKGLTTQDQDGISKNMMIFDSYIKKTVTTNYFTTDLSYDEKIDLSGINNEIGTLNIDLSPSLFKENILGNTQNIFSYDSLSQKTYNIFKLSILKNIYNQTNKTLDFDNNYVNVYSNTTKIYNKISINEYIKTYLQELKNYKKYDGGYSYYISSNLESSFDLTIKVYKTLNYLKDLGFEFDDNFISDSKKYILDNITNKQTCGEKYYKGCVELESKIAGLIGVLQFDNLDTNLFNIYQKLDISENIDISNLELLYYLQKLEYLGENDKNSISKNFGELYNKIISNNLVYLPRGAFISLEGFDKIYNTSKLLQIIGETNIETSTQLVDNLTKFLSYNNENLDMYELESILDYIKTQNIDFNYKYGIKLNGEDLFTNLGFDDIFDNENIIIPLSDLGDKTNTLTFQKTDNGKLYYNINLNYYTPSYDADNIDRGFYVTQKYYSYDDYKNIKDKKDSEYEKYINGEINYSDLVYKNNIESYLTEITDFNIGDLVIASNNILVENDTKNVIFESYIPSGSEILNFDLSTTSTSNNIVENDFEFDTKKLLEQKYFGYKNKLETGIYNYSYVLRMTHSGTFNIKPSKVYDLNHEEIFGTSAGSNISIK